MPCLKSARVLLVQQTDFTVKNTMQLDVALFKKLVAEGIRNGLIARNLWECLLFQSQVASSIFCAFLSKAKLKSKFAL